MADTFTISIPVHKTLAGPGFGLLGRFVHQMGW